MTPKPYYFLLLACMLSVVQLAAQQQLPLPVDNFANYPGNLKNIHGSAGPASRSLRGSIPGDQQRSNAPICMDTALRKLYRDDSSLVYPNFLSYTSDGNIVTQGFYVRSDNNYSAYDGYVNKLTPKGDIIWAKKLSGGYLHRNFAIIKVQELLNTDLLLFGSMGKPTPYNGTTELFLSRLDASGNYRWHKTFKYLRFADTTSGDFNVSQIKEAADGSIYLTGSFQHQGPPRGALVMKFSANGNFLWSTDIDAAGYPYGYGIDINGNEVRMFARSSYGDWIYAAANLVMIARLNANNGDTLSVKAWSVPISTASWYQTLSSGNIVKLDNGNIAVYGRASGDSYWFNGPPDIYHVNVLVFDSNLRGLYGYSIASDALSNGSITRMNVYPDGSMSYLWQHYISSYSSDMQFGQVRNNKIVKERVFKYRGNSTPWASNILKDPDGSNLMVFMNYDSAAAKSGFEFLKLNETDTSSDCLGLDNFVSRIVYLPTLIEYPLYVSQVYKNQVVETFQPFYGISDKPLNIYNSCFQESFCDALDITAADSVLCTTGLLHIKFKTNKECGARPAWSYDTTGIEQFRYINDSTLEVKFNRTWAGYFKAEMFGCALLRDSIFVRVTAAAAPVNLGQDRQLCPGNTITLNARTGYLSYLWQDGSADSTFTVTQPGTYFVKTTDACGGNFSDTVFITAAPPIPFSVGPDRQKCNRDSIQLTAPAGFLNYTWSNNYNISSLTSQNVTVFPLVDTTYYVRAEKTPGCFAYDTVFIKVTTSPPVYLGPDRSFCAGDSATFSVAGTFNSYAWNTGATSQSIVAKAAGSYAVIATTAQGCRSYDTVRVLQVHSNPVLSLGTDGGICSGKIKTFDAGNFTSYLWNTGSTSRIITVTIPGEYSVAVSDNNGCRGSDTVVVTEIYPTPADFLFADTSMCTYGSLVLKPLSDYQTYAWNTGARTALITIERPGKYWLEVSTDKGCLGRDTVSVAQKDCLEGFFVPSAFTPNADRTNDLFQPLLFGNVVKYRFTVYNRYGQVVFHSTDRFAGWNGTVAGKPQDSNVFVWVCSYQFAGQPEKIQKGSVVLVR